MQSLELQQMGLVPITQSEMEEIDGGSWLSLARGLGITWLADQIVNNWDDIKAGFKDGYNAKL